MPNVLTSGTTVKSSTGSYHDIWSLNYLVTVDTWSLYQVGHPVLYNGTASTTTFTITSGAATVFSSNVQWTVHTNTSAASTVGNVTMPRGRHSNYNSNTPSDPPEIKMLPKTQADEVGGLISWNDLKVGDHFVVLKPENRFIDFCEVDRVVRKSNCVIIRRRVIDQYDTISRSIQEGKYTIEEGKRKGTWCVYFWDQNLRKQREIRGMKDKADSILSDLFGRTSDNARRAKERRDTGSYQVAHRSMFANARNRLDRALDLLEMTHESTAQDFKKVTRAIAMSWHPDRKLVYIGEKKGTEEQFERESRKYYDALSEVQDFIRKRDSMEATNGN